MHNRSETTEVRYLCVIADDLSGAAEALSAALGSAKDDARPPAMVHLNSTKYARYAQFDAWYAVDLDCRNVSPLEARCRYQTALHGVRGRGPHVRMLKIDSLLRGNVAAALASIQPCTSCPVIVAPALPAQGRRTVNGRVVLPDSATQLGHLEGVRRNVVEVMDRAASVVPVDRVRRGEQHLVQYMRELATQGYVCVCDAETDHDLTVIASVALTFSNPVLVGASGLAAAIGRQLVSQDTSMEGDPARKAVRRTCPLSSGRVLVVVGTAEPSVDEQIGRLHEVGVPVVESSPTEALADVIRRVSECLQCGTVVLRTPAALQDHVEADEILIRIASIAIAAVADQLKVGLVLTGGATARAVLDRLGVHSLHLCGQVHSGAAHVLTTEGRHIVIRPGSHGTDDSLLLAVRYLGGFAAAGVPHTVVKENKLQESSMTTTLASVPSQDIESPPIIGITMGDGAGIGPEVIAGALADPAVRAACQPLVVGDGDRLRKAAERKSVKINFRSIKCFAEAQFSPDSVDVIDLGLLPDDLPWGETSAIAGDAAYQYIRVATELAIRHKIQAICTAPLNKEALHAGGHIFPGHTEMLAHLTDTDEVSMMLSTPKVRVVHVTTHVGLVDAIARINPELVERTVRRGHAAVVATGISNPVIGVLGINPHAGENGLFGYGEEEEKIEPAIEKLRAVGIDARGPLPADTAFFLASRGDYDLIVAMYHDQGHGPVKILGIEAGVNITVGLPVIRTSVDHGTAFDIAGTGKADERSMIEALRQAVELAPSVAAQEREAHVS